MPKVRIQQGMAPDDVMAAREAVLTAEFLRSVVTYRPSDGALIRTVKTAANAPVGALVGRISNGYMRGFINGTEYFVHRLIWLYVKGVWPSGFLDHINGDRSDNRIDNLREATIAQNNANRSKNRMALLKGVTRERKRWRAQIGKSHGSKYLGSFDTPEQAHEAYVAAAKERFGEFARFK